MRLEHQNAHVNMLIALLILTNPALFPSVVAAQDDAGVATGRILLDDAGVVTGRILLPDRKTPAREARVVAVRGQGSGTGFSSDYVGVPDAGGRFVIAGIEPERVSFWIAHPQYAPQRVTVLISPRKPKANITIVLKRNGGTIGGVVTQPNGKPVASAPVVAFPATALDPIAEESFFEMTVSNILKGGEADVPKPIQARSRTDATGRFQLDHLTPGYYVVLVQVGGPLPLFRRRVTIADNRRTNLRLTLATRRGVLVLGLVDTQGRPIKDAHASVMMLKSGLAWETERDTDGSGEIALWLASDKVLTKGRYTLSIALPGYRSTEQVVDFSPTSVREGRLRIVLLPAKK